MEPTYDPDCPDCKGTGCLYGHPHNPPEQCSCIARFDPEPEKTPDEEPEKTPDELAELAGEYWADSERNGD